MAGLVNLALITGEALDALKYGVQRANAGIEEAIANAIRQNEAIEARNLQKKPEFQEALVPVPELATLQSYADKVITDRLASLGQELFSAKEALFKETIMSMDAAERDQLMASLGVPNVLKE